MQSIIELINNYGYLILFFALVLELIALPIPGEPMMTYCGFLVYEARLNWIISILVAFTGTTLGITISYFIGSTLGTEFFKKYGSFIHLTPKRLEKASKWFNLYGDRLLIFAYFIPGIRHLTGYFSGITRISFKKFALNAYFGAFIWVSTFISLGNFLGLNWYRIHEYLRTLTIIGVFASALVLISIYFYRNQKVSMKSFSYKSSFIFSIPGKIKIAVITIAATLLGLFTYYTL